MNTAALATVLGVLSFGQTLSFADPAHAADNDCSAGSACSDQLADLLKGEANLVRPGAFPARADNVQKKSLGSNSEQQLPLSSLPGFSISVDGEVVAGSRGGSSASGGRPAGSVSSVDRIVDVGLDAVDVDVRFDGLDVRKQLGVSVVGERRMVRAGERVEFFGNWNYPAWVDRAEVRVYRRSEVHDLGVVRDARALDVIDMGSGKSLADGFARGAWIAPDGNGFDLARGSSGSFADGAGSHPYDGSYKGGGADGAASHPYDGSYKGGGSGEAGHARDGGSYKGEADHDLVYTLRVYDGKGRFDETAPLPLKVTSSLPPSALSGPSPASPPTDAEGFADTQLRNLNGAPIGGGSGEAGFARDGGSNQAGGTPGYGVDQKLISNIPVHGGSVTVYGRNVPAGYRVHVMGADVPLGHDNTKPFPSSALSGLGPEAAPVGGSHQHGSGTAFVVNRILPPGDHGVDVRIARDHNGGSSGGANGGSYKNGGVYKGGSDKSRHDTLSFERDINIPDNEWFYVGLADLTVGLRTGDDSEVLTAAAPGEYDDVYHKGRLAFYLKGKVKGKYIITAALDTTEEDLDVVFSNLDEKDPRQLLRRLDPDDHYPVYGDDSTFEEDAPTSGRFYVKVERGESHVMWGNFKTRINGTEFARYERGLYGAHALLKSEETTSFGEPVATLEGFAAQPGTLAQRDELRGTGGSAYFLRRQDINQGSEQIVIEERDRVTGLIVSRQVLVKGRDYELDYVQGVILLNTPLQSTTASSTVIQDDALGGNDLYLVAQYEFTPGLSDVDGYSYGGRGEAWLSDHVRVGVTGYREDTGAADQTLWGADLTLRLAEKSYFEFEWAESEGDTFGIVTSTDGGYIFNNVTGAGVPGEASTAWRAKVALDLEDLTGPAEEGGIKGKVGAHYEEREAGFNAPGRYTSVDERIWGAFGEVEINENVSVAARYDDVEKGDGRARREGTGEVKMRFDERWSATFAVQHSDVEDPTAIATTSVGSRTDLGLRITQRIDDSTKAWVFGQVTVDRDRTRERNDRIGVGFEADITDQITASAEVSYGTSGIGALAALSYEPTASERYYLGYRLAPEQLDGATTGDGSGYDPFGRDYGAIVFGATRKLDDRLSAYFEENYDITGRQRSYTHTYGVTYTPDDVWKVTAGIEAGEIEDSVSGDFDRIAVSAGINYSEEGKDAGLRLEARFEDGITDDTRDRNTYLARAHMGLDYNDDWRFLAKLDAVISSSDEDTILDGDYVEGSIGWAYRPVDNDRFNALFKYTFLYDLPGAEQVNANNQLLGPAQRSHVLSADFVYDVNQYLSVGAKYGFRIGEVSTDRTADTFVDSSAHLGILRADMHIVHEWDLLLEGRVLHLPELDQTNYGVLAGIYRHVGENAKIGVGYNFGRFSDDITDLTLDDEGFFINVIGKF